VHVERHAATSRPSCQRCSTGPEHTVTSVRGVMTTLSAPRRRAATGRAGAGGRPRKPSPALRGAGARPSRTARHRRRGRPRRAGLRGPTGARPRGRGACYSCYSCYSGGRARAAPGGHRAGAGACYSCYPCYSRASE
jgi:hypothetical protein